MHIRATTEPDWPILKALRLAALRDAPTAFGVTHASAAANSDQQWRDRAAARGPASYLLAFSGDTPVGMIGGLVSAAQEFNLIAMWLTPEHRGSGAAAALVEAMKAHALAQGHQRVVLDVSPDNARAAAFYAKLGFRFLPHWEALESHPHIQLQKMEWCR
ncbi:Acetyltransferase (GNAT) family protein [Duganella sp. CF458]|uniref:GNAT family N-acetyltransferase n=1 Tax=Duganella sp. CF458 TaxID=1884368 RepID=UPI0008E631D6|nr:GNAT family N-acetyltransferase [Duganella sp. CF458]SFG19736.1 Acetyltransferase (GNAT) family protein [Duganella sp. CF458]